MRVSASIRIFALTAGGANILGGEGIYLGNDQGNVLHWNILRGEWQQTVPHK